MNKIILVGYMGSGKSTVGKALANSLNIPFYDLDSIIEQNLGLSISEIFNQKGEVFFRKYEHQALHQFLENHSQFVLSLGGGTPCYANNHEVLKNTDIASFYLKTSINEIVNRLLQSNNQRPLIVGKSKEELTEYVAKHLFDRSYFYHQSKNTVLTDGKTTDAVVAELVSKLT
ncbi:shikimate kinase [Flavobacterium agricola]|uniref:Shikimate kinase n=1 Tax=Flavobacterium agricola TaxID=2870839 RepID=A0ABY6LYK0_9FLAO|nr:shikimate kinase [Flavobacterium agricola]UYW00474.1 shikimate kinase [Flavobacterium agricola]